mgnify:CR=1 FL=1
MEFIIINPAICHGKPTIKGTRIMVQNICSLVEGGYSLQKIKNYYPELIIPQIKAAIKYID